MLATIRLELELYLFTKHSQKKAKEPIFKKLRFKLATAKKSLALIAKTRFIDDAFI